MRTTSPLFLATALLSLLVANSALAETPTTPEKPAPPNEATEWEANATKQRVGLDYDLWPADSVAAMTWELNAHVKVMENLYVDASYAWGYLNVSTSLGGGGDQGFYGNPTLGAHYTKALDEFVPNLRAYGGFAWTPPVLSDPGATVAFSAAYTSSIRGSFDVGRTAPYYTTFRFNLGAEYQILPNLYYRGDLNPVIYAPTNGNVGADTEFILEQSNEIEYRFDMGVGAGFRLQEAFTLSGNDLIQTAMEPFVTYTPEKQGLYGRLGLLIALDEQLGFGFDQGKLAAVRLSVGYQFQ